MTGVRTDTREEVKGVRGLTSCSGFDEVLVKGERGFAP